MFCLSTTSFISSNLPFPMKYLELIFFWLKLNSSIISASLEKTNSLNSSKTSLDEKSNKFPKIELIMITLLSKF